MKDNSIYGHYAAIITIVIWRTTFISTKVLLSAFLPIEILILRFAVGYVALLLISPHMIKFRGIKEEFIFALAGLTGICLYYMLENIALTYTLASNVGVIISLSPFFTAIIGSIINKEKVKPNFYIGFLFAIMGIILISLNGSSLSLNPKGDILALMAAFIWAIYSHLTKKISTFNYNVIQSTRRIFFWGIVFMLPIILISDASFPPYAFKSLKNVLNLLYLGLGASALCFATWNYAVSSLGAVKTSIYIYLVPVITIIFSSIFLSEKITVMMILGTVLTLTGLFISGKTK